MTVKDKIKHLMDPNLDYETEELANQTLYYLERDNNNKIIALTFFDDIMYKVEAELDDRLTKQDVFDYMEKVITKVNN
ncbi:hypothetical protein E3U55_06205 [Filobacillus milosensis]|uniref:Uncharacterized protein n=1 Tax=Filobacillus milosensis TaxID=94137 RepID=A0A4Y8IN28_9BACI|nr:hypothetical protein [Filobacillus milosensis]TFB22827.1 hypothetical protein E3U55_06205 [Filobacillus milosensis]